MRVAIVGSRDFKHLYYIRDYIAKLSPDTVVVSGGARGVDSAAENWARERGLSVVVIPASWERDGRAAGFLRNTKIVALCDAVVAFWDEKSRGTEDTLMKALADGKDVKVCNERGEWYGYQG